jgi:hypothetical protein
MTVKYRLTRDIYRDASFHLAKTVTGNSVWTIYFGLWTLLTVLSNWVLSIQLMVSSPASARLVVAGLIAGAIVALIAYKSRKAASEVEPQEISFIFSEMGVDKRTLHSEAKLEWKAYVKFSETDKFYFLHYSKRLADIVPKAAFATPQDVDAFRELLLRQVRPASLDFRSGRRGFLLLLILIFIAIMMVVWTRSTFVPRPAGAPNPAVPETQEH